MVTGLATVAARRRARIPCLGEKSVTVDVPADKEALQRLFERAQGDSGQCAVVARFLAGLYNGSRFPFVLTDLRRLDDALFEDAMTVLRMDARHCIQEAHEYFDNGGRRFEAMIADKALDGVAH